MYRCRKVIYRIAAGTRVERVRIGKERLASRLFEPLDDAAQKDRSYVRRIPGFAEMKLYRDKIVRSDLRVDLRSVHEIDDFIE